MMKRTSAGSRNQLAGDLRQSLRGFGGLGLGVLVRLRLGLRGPLATKARGLGTIGCLMSIQYFSRPLRNLLGCFAGFA